MLARRVHLRALRSARSLASACPYVGVPFSDMTPSRRGFIFENIVREYDDHNDAFETRDASESLAANGWIRCGSNTVYDWIRAYDGHDRRVELKSASFTYDKSNQRWGLAFYAVKTEEFDDLVLAVYAPWGLELWEYKLSGGLAGLYIGTKTRGARVSFWGKSKVADILEAWQSSILPKLSVAATHTVSLSRSNPLVRKHMKRGEPDTPYMNAPLKWYSPTYRSQFLSEVVRRFVNRSCKRPPTDPRCIDGDASAIGLATRNYGTAHRSSVSE